MSASINKLDHLLGLPPVCPRYEEIDEERFSKVKGTQEIFATMQWYANYKKKFMIFIDLHEWVEPSAYCWKVRLLVSRSSPGSWVSDDMFGVADSLVKAKFAVLESIRRHLRE